MPTTLLQEDRPLAIAPQMKIPRPPLATDSPSSPGAAQNSACAHCTRRLYKIIEVPFSDAEETLRRGTE